MPFAASPRSFYRRCLRVPTNDGEVNDKSVVSDDFSLITISELRLIDKLLTVSKS